MARTRFALAAALILTPAAAAQPEAETDSATVESLLACRTLAEAGERLACMDTALNAFSTAIESGRLVIVEREAVRAVERDSFGLSLPSVAGLGALLTRGADDMSASAAGAEESMDDGSTVVYGRDGEVAEIRGLAVADVRTVGRGDLLVELENGQVWVQSDSTRVQPVLRRHLREGLTAEIKQRAFGSYTMQLSHARRTFAVRRRD